ncbi:MAG TPA: hypothetical protein VJL90_07055 [Pseudorhodoplanes sp.]|nr:hypothetical protein [Pseudorhodoplanes sp.]
MADYDPNRDFRDPNRLNNLNDLQTPNWDAERNANASWGWILGGLAAVVLVLAALSFGRNDSQTASNEPSTTQTRPANPGGMTPPAARTPTQPSTTGQAPTQGQAPQQ